MGDISRFNYGELMGFLSVGGGCLSPVIAIVGALWADIRKAELAAALKHDMLDRGLSADEIQEGPQRRQEARQKMCRAGGNRLAAIGMSTSRV